MRKLLLWLRRLFIRQQPPKFHPWRLRPELDLFTFRSDEQNVAYMRDLFRTDFFQQVLVVLHNSRPRGYPPRGQKLDNMELAVELGRIEGYESVLALMEVMTKSNPKQDEIQATWANPDEPESQQESPAMPPV